MPEYHQIQAYLSLENRSHRDAIAMFREVLATTTTRTAAREAWLSQVSGELTFIDGFGYVASGPELSVALGMAELTVRPHVLGWTPAANPRLSSRWTEVSLLIESERIELRRLEEPRYRPEFEPLLLHLVTSFIPISIDSPTFLTNEASEGHPWSAFIGGDDDPCFDAAVAHADLSWPRETLPARYHLRSHEGGTVVVRQAAWHTRA